ncbi:SLC13 family permease [Persicobacter psychrovividus]|uniref:Sodium:sulfate symporter n=1 Tax=Persicobacter psychrovividus TaxID=387638 RepID=A0ABM7VFS9_9BACT|nr:sodium:sulfate symporter [Persicobacter psychrovividus]
MLSEAAQPYFVIAATFLLFVFIYLNKIRASVGFLLTGLLFAVMGILHSKDLLIGFSNSSIASVVLLILITAGLRKNFNLAGMIDKLFPAQVSYKGFLARMMAKVAILSSIINNTPVVAIMTPYIISWGKRNKISPSKLLIPLSFATILGGMITQIGTSTTLVLQGFLESSDLPSIQPFDLFRIGGTVVIVGIAFFVLYGHRLLPDRQRAVADFRENIREFVVETHLSDRSKLVGKTILEAGLRNLKGVYLVEILRGDRVISPVEPEEIIQGGDSLFFAGDTSSIHDLVKSMEGLRLPKDKYQQENEAVRVIETVIAKTSPLIGRTVKTSGFRNRYDAAVVAIHRQGERLSGKIGNMTLLSGDLLLLYAGPNFTKNVNFFSDLHVVNQVEEFAKPSKQRSWALILTALISIGLAATGVYPLFLSLMVIFSVMAATKLISITDIKRTIDLDMLAILAFSLVLGRAMVVTKAGDLLAAGLLEVLQPIGPLAVLVGLFIITIVLTSFVTNVGAVSIAFPLALSISHQMGMDGTPLYLAIAYAASGAFLTPIGYQTNLMVFAPGGYTFSDFIKVGLPMTLIYMVVVITAICVLYHSCFF